MPPVPIHSSSPISASKASGVTPKTQGTEAQTKAQPVTASATQPYPPPQPGAVPSLPVQTATAQAYAPPSFQPTPTRKADTDSGPAPPQPGAVPSPPGKTSVPPPPKAGETYQPPQMTMPPPTSSYSPQRGTSTSTAPLAGPLPTTLGVGAGAGVGAASATDNLSHPPGYQQNVNASEGFSRSEGPGYNPSASTSGNTFDGAEEGVWDTAKKWAQAAGGNLAAAEKEVWRRINNQ